MESIIIIISFIVSIFVVVASYKEIANTPSKEWIAEQMSLISTLRYESTCLKRRWSVGVYDKNLQLIATGVNIACDGKNCAQCKREAAGIGGGYELCPAVHAECNGARAAVDVLHDDLSECIMIQTGDLGTESFRPCIFCGEFLSLLKLKALYGHDKEGNVHRWNKRDCYGGKRLP